MTAHHANDQVETLLMNLERQTGVSGLRGIAKERENILRPMLAFSKIEIIEFSKRIGYKYYEDLSNHRWCVDEEEDLEVIRKVFDHFHPNIFFGWKEVLELSL